MDVRALARRMLLLVAFLALAAAPTLNFAQTPTSNDSPGGEGKEVKGLVEAVPPVDSSADGRVGEWKVNGTVFSVASTTLFNGFGLGRPEVGRCVEVKLTIATPPVALSISPDDSCTHSSLPGEPGQPGQPGDSGDHSWRGTVTTVAANGFSGDWTIGGKVFNASAATFFVGFGATPPVSGACLEVDYNLAGTVNQASKIQAEEARDCSQTGRAPLPSDEHLYRARVDQRPTGSRFGTSWVIGGKTFEAVVTSTATISATTFSLLFGEDVAKPAVGDCVSVFYREVTSATQTTTRPIREISPAVCEGVQPPAGQRYEAYGWLNQVVTGTYSIGPVKSDLTTSISYTVVPTTELKAEYGPLTPTVCVQVEYRTAIGANGARTALEIKSRPDFRCAASEDARELYGEITALPAATTTATTTTYLGKWTIGNVEVVVTKATKLEHGPFAVGRLVKIKFTRASDGSLVAVKIEGKGSPSASDRTRERGRGKAYGKIETLGAVPGAWTIASQVYTVTTSTSLRSTNLVQGDCVEVYFTTDTAGQRTAVKIERSSEGCTTRYTDESGRALGYVDSLPTTGYTGTWIIGGSTYTVTELTKFETIASVGAPVKGSFVEVRYKIVNSARIAVEISSRVSPGQGDASVVGKLSAATGLAATGTGTVGNTTFQINDATIIQDGATNVANGATVRVNGYYDAQGKLVATQVSAITPVYVPLIAR